MSKISPCLWFATEAEEAANFYVSLLPDSRIDHVQRNVSDSPGGKKGTVLVVDFNDQAEVDRLWDALSAGGAVERCGWLKDRYGLSWQIVPTALPKLLGDPDQAKAQRVMQALRQMVKIDVAELERAHGG